jgi:hypothetical protein
VPNATVTGSWGGGTSGTGSCTTGTTGTCVVTKSNIPNQNGIVTFTVSSVTHATLTYDSGSNHDPDGDSNGTAITVAR